MGDFERWPGHPGPEALRAGETPEDRGGRFSWPRAALLLLVLWWTISLGSGAADWCFLDLVNLAFHEAGHLFLSFGGTTLHFLGGTLGQLLVPALLAANFLLRERQPFAAALCVWWVGESLINVSVYMADARSLSLPLVGGGDHDWNELFHRFGLLTEPAVRRVATATRLLGLATMVSGIAWGAYVLLGERARTVLGLSGRAT